MDWLFLLRFLLKPVAIYIIALAVVRWMGKRALGTLSLFDLVIMAGIGDVIVVVGLEQRVPFERGVLILAMLGGLEWLFSMLSFRSRFFAGLLEGKPTVLVKNGELLEANLAKEHISKADLYQELRKEGVARLSQVSQAVLEACGKFSVILKEEDDPVPVQQLLVEVGALRRELQELKVMITSKES
ncbi:uncharacterized membrane protein YcaP (DUF421 family) [Hydrogenispora ethanolica]|jgi:uncharacterized membrane protein YcaP (DUF421 family)|uniref:Uncharacterized membrane protein YcaP (DUF421 family) n=1 Tax=Hydrogenispora ethanolica TaxID=1082276 RepID=A0A4R1R7I8_HYDET|nr:YetF domain-containing protein [Hydrogenispora ethanolica]TCL61528.1 uncharacterized membrane protein YcaP (DUF421 family) [Hydrogenispora ethanolica]